NGTLSIAGPGASSLTIHGSFNIDAATVSISGLTLRNGQGPVGGAIRANNGSLTINGVYFFENFGAEGGAIFLMGGTHSIVNSTFESNLATGSCGAIANEVATLYIANSTFFFNAPGDNGVGSGGALCSTGAGSSTVLRNVTIWQNGPINAGTGGGIYVEDSSVNIGNSIIAGNAAPGGKPDIHLVSGSVTSAGNNLIGDNSGDSADTEGAIAYQLSDKLDIDPKLMLPATNGGQTRTVALMAGSPAIDAGNNSLAVNPADGNPLVTDQRGVDRILDGNGDSTATVDIGAYETLVPTAAPVSLSGRVATATGEAIRGASVTISGGGLAEPRTVLTGTFGNYSFGDLQTGTTYVVTVSARRYYFSVPSRVVTLTDNVAGVDFVAGQQ